MKFPSVFSVSLLCSVLMKLVVSFKQKKSLGRETQASYPAFRLGLEV